METDENGNIHPFDKQFGVFRAARINEMPHLEKSINVIEFTLSLWIFILFERHKHHERSIYLLCTRTLIILFFMFLSIFVLCTEKNVENGMDK